MVAVETGLGTDCPTVGEGTVVGSPPQATATTSNVTEVVIARNVLRLRTAIERYSTRQLQVIVRLSPKLATVTIATETYTQRAAKRGNMSATQRWAEMVRAEHAQSDSMREEEPPADSWNNLAQNFRAGICRFFRHFPIRMINNTFHNLSISNTLFLCPVVNGQVQSQKPQRLAF